MQRILTFMMVLLAITLISACGNSHTHAEEEAHEHGPETHTHSEVADTAGTYVDSTAAFFGDEGHEHGPETHEHDGDEAHESDDDGHAHGPETHEHDDDDQGHQ